jgi:hypothetical protein
MEKSSSNESARNKALRAQLAEAKARVRARALAARLCPSRTARFDADVGAKSRRPLTNQLVRPAMPAPRPNMEAWRARAPIITSPLAAWTAPAPRAAMPIRAAPAKNRDDVAAALRQIRRRRDAGIGQKRRGAGSAGHQSRGPEDETRCQNYSDLSHLNNSHPCVTQRSSLPCDSQT